MANFIALPAQDNVAFPYKYVNFDTVTEFRIVVLEHTRLAEVRKWALNVYHVGRNGCDQYVFNSNDYGDYISWEKRFLSELEGGENRRVKDQW